MAALAPAVESPEARFLALLRAGDHDGAAALAQERTIAVGRDGRWWAYLGSALALQDRHEDAVDAFARAECLGQGDFLGKAMLYQRARALAAQRLHVRARGARQAR